MLISKEMGDTYLIFRALYKISDLRSDCGIEYDKRFEYDCTRVHIYSNQ